MFREEAGFDEGVFIEVEHGRGAGLIIDRPVKAITLSYICIILYSYSFSPTNIIIFAIDENGPAKGSDSISSAWQRERFESTCVAPGGTQEGGGGLLPARGAGGPVCGLGDAGPDVRGICRGPGGCADV